MINAADHKFDVYRAVEAAKDVAGNGKAMHARIYLPYRHNSSYTIDRPLDLGGLPPHTILEGDGNSILWLYGDGTVSADGTPLTIRNVRFRGDPTDPPQVGLTMARNAKADSVNGWSLQDCVFDGHFEKAAIYNLCAECSSLQNVFVANEGRGHGIFYDTNDRLMAKRFTAFHKFTNSRHHLSNVSITTQASGTPLVIAGGTTDLNLVDGLLHANGGRAFVALESYPASFGRANQPRVNKLGAVMLEGFAENAVLYRSIGGQNAPELLPPFLGIWKGLANAAARSEVA